MFKYKTQAELAAMTEAEQDKYAADKREHEAKIQKEAIAEATKDVAKLPETVKAEVKAAIEALKADGISKEQIDEIKENIAQLKEQGAIGAAKVFPIADEVKKHKDSLGKMMKGEGGEITLKADTTRASVNQTTQGIQLPGIGQLIRVARSLYNIFRKVNLPIGTHNGTIKYLDWDEATTVKSAGMVAEGAVFPESTAAFKEYTLSLKKVGDTLPVTEEFFEDEALAAAELEIFLQNNVESKVDDQIVNGDNTGENLKGLLASVDAYAPVASGIQDANIYDLITVVEAGITKAAGAKYHPDFAAMNKTTINRLLLKKDANDNYQFPPNHPIFNMAVEDNSIADNVLVVGDSRFATIYEMNGVTLSRNVINNQFVKDMLTLKARKRLLFLIKNSDKSGFRKVTDISAALVTLAS